MANSRYEVGGKSAATAALEPSHAERAEHALGRPRLCLLGVVGGTTLALDLPTSRKTTFGRSAEADIAVTHPTISRVHAAFFVTTDGDMLRCEVEDLGSLNGTRVRGERLAANERVELKPGDTVDLGSTSFLLQRRHHATSQPPKPTPVLLGSSPTTRSLAEAVDAKIAPPLSLQAELDEIERERVLRTFEECGGDPRRAAEILGMSRATLLRRLESYGFPQNR